MYYEAITSNNRFSFRINSVHEQAINRLADGLAIEAVTPDGIMEAVRIRDSKTFAYKVQ